MQAIFQDNYMPKKEVVVDESLLLYKGRLHFRQYIKSKRARFGVKIFSLCSSDGYMYAFEIYSGQGEQQFAVAAGDGGNLSISERIVVYLAKNILDLGYSIYTDNWYTSNRLAEYLLRHGTLHTGTIRTNRGVPDAVRDAQLQRHQTAFARKDNMLVLKYSDTRDIYLLTSEFTAELSERQRYVAGAHGHQEYFKKPTAIQNYTLSMRGVDKLDQLLHSYNCTRKSYAWFKKVGLHFLQRALLNAFYVYKELNESSMSFLTFTMYAIEFLVDGTTVDVDRTEAGLQVRRRRRPANVTLQHQQVGRNPSAHIALKLEPTPNKRRPQRRCVLCWNRTRTRRDTRYYCGTCPNKPALCMQNCFAQYAHH
jgi:hypothetical protein